MACLSCGLINCCYSVGSSALLIAPAYHSFLYIRITQLLLKLTFFSFVLLQLSFQMWTDQMQETLNSRKKGDVAFKEKDFKTAIDWYSQVRSCSSFEEFELKEQSLPYECMLSFN